MPKLKAKQIALGDSFGADGSGNLALAAGGVAGSHLADGTITSGKLSQALLNLISRGITMRESVLVVEQLLATGIAPAAMVRLSSMPDINDTLVLKNADQTETFTFKNVAHPAENDFEIGMQGGDTNSLLTRLAAEINAHSAGWSAVIETGLDAFAGTVCVIYRKEAVAAGDEDDRVYATAGNKFRHVDFGGGRYDAAVSNTGVISSLDSDDLVALADADPEVATFGFGRAIGDLIDGDTRFIMADNTGYSFNLDGQAWNISLGGTASVDDTTIEYSNGALQVKDGGITAAKLGADVAGNGLTGGDGEALAVLAENGSVAVGAGGVKAAVPVLDDKALNPAGAVAADEGATGLTLTKTPAAGSHVSVRLNGVGVEVGGDKTKDCYFSADDGATARALGAAQAGDELFWNAVISGIALAVTDELDFEYVHTTA